jgi:polysaccharide deacetylase family protein (PEP-CTERM system associated)
VRAVSPSAAPGGAESRGTAPPAVAPPARRGSAAPTNVFTVDVEDYFHVEAFADVVDRSTWDGYALRVEDNTKRLLDLLDERGVEATFFILGWVAERRPGLVREIVARGHEPACHSYWHRLIYKLSPGEFREDTRRAKDVIEQAGGRAVDGYRAPSYSVTTASLWALEVLAELGFSYDSSIFPIRHDVYGIPDAPRAPFRVATPSGPLVEFPITTFRLLGDTNLPVGGGGYLRIFPFWYTRLGVRRARGERLPVIAYVHPWEVDPDQPRLRGRATSRLRHYTNLAKTYARLGALLELGEFSSFARSGLADAATETHLLTRIAT